MTWQYGQRYDGAGFWNPRLVACEQCGVYNEPDLTVYDETQDETLCLDCADKE